MLKFLFPDLKVRSHLKEKMDDPDCHPKKLLRTLSQFTLLNILFSRSRTLMKKYFLREMQKNPQKNYTLLDLGAGGCDLPRWLIKKTRKLHLKLKITCLEIDKRIITFAAKKIKSYPEITLLKHSAFEINSFPQFDFIFANHFLHHLDDQDLPMMLARIIQKTRLNFVLNDIKRSLLSYLGYTFFTGLFLHRSFAFYDGRLSIQKGFREKEWREKFADYLDKIQIQTQHPARIFLTLNKN